MAAEVRPLVLPSEAEAELRARELGHHATSRSEALRLRRRAYKIHDLSSDERALLAEGVKALGGDVLLSMQGGEGIFVIAEGQLRALAALTAAAASLSGLLERFAAALEAPRWVDGAGKSLLAAERTTIMGILNVTPDSFSDGGRFNDPGRAEERATRMVEEGADMIDVGGMSARPDAPEIDPAEEMARILPIIGRLARKLNVPISVDTYRADVAEKALDAGATVVNDISGLAFDERMAPTCARKKAAVVLMHTSGKPDVMMRQTAYRDLVRDVRRGLEYSFEKALAAGIAQERIVVDPGFCFGKTADQGWDLLRRLREFAGIAPLLVGLSRKSMFKAVLGDTPPEERDTASGAAVTAAVLAGAAAVRVHNVKVSRECAAVADRLTRAPRL